MQSLIVDITINAEQYLTQYRVPSAVVVTRARCGRRVKFPANILQPFVSHSGISGSFQITFDNSGKFAGISRLA